MNIDSVSVIIPWGKRSGDVAACLQSVLSQDPPPAEVLLVCNGPVSIDYAREELDDTLLERITLLDGSSCTNANEARNLGVLQASSTWVAFMDSDDSWDTDHLKESIAALHQEGASLCYGSIWVSEKGREYVREAYHFSESGTPENYLLSYAPAVTPSYVCRRDLAENIPWDPTLRRHQDYDWFTRVSRAVQVAVVKKPTVRIDWTEPTLHRFHGDCLRVVREWTGRVEKRYLIRHLLRHGKQSLLARDRAFFSISLFLFRVLFFSRGWHPDRDQ